jgi:CheY-like chemotaxis protein
VKTVSLTVSRNVLLIDDNASHAEAFREALIGANDEPSTGDWVRTLAEGSERLQQQKIWAIFLNLHINGRQGLSAFDELLKIFDRQVPLFNLCLGQRVPLLPGPRPCSAGAAAP